MITNGDYLPEKFNEEWKSLRFSKKILRVLVLILIFGSIFFIFSHWLTFQNIYLTAVINYVLFLGIIEFLFFKGIPYVYYLMGIDIKGDLLRFDNKTSFYKLYLD